MSLCTIVCLIQCEKDFLNYIFSFLCIAKQCEKHEFMIITREKCGGSGFAYEEVQICRIYPSCSIALLTILI